VPLFTNNVSKNQYSILFYIVSFLLMLGAQSTQAQTIKFYAEHYPPYAMDVSEESGALKAEAAHIDTEEALEGLDVDLIRKAYAEMGVDTEFEFHPWKRVVRDVKLGNVLGGISCRRTKAREAFVNFSNPVSQSRLAFITGDNFKGRLPQNFEDLKLLNVVIVSGYSQQSMLDSQGVKYSAASSVIQGLNLVQRRDQDVFFSGWEGAAYEAKRLGYLDELIFTQPSIDAVKTYHVCFSKNFSGSDKWRLLLNEGLEKIRIQGLMKTIQHKYGIKE
jgi:polar amino acid transport system substrate-binding protein